MKRTHSTKACQSKKQKTVPIDLFAPLDQAADIFDSVMSYIDSRHVISQYRLVSKRWNYNILNNTHFNLVLTGEGAKILNKTKTAYLERVTQLCIRSDSIIAFGRIKEMTYLKKISLVGVRIDKKHQRRFALFRCLSILEVRKCSLPPEFMKYVSQVKTLKDLELGRKVDMSGGAIGKPIDMNGIQNIKSLESLSVDRIKGTQLHLLIPLKGLKKIHITDIYRESQVVCDFLAGKDNLESLTLIDACLFAGWRDGPIYYDSTILNQFNYSFKKLNKLKFRIDELTNHFMSMILSLEQLEDLDMDFRVLHQLSPARRKKLKKLSIKTKVPFNFNNSFGLVFDCESLEELSIFCPFPYECMEGLKVLSNLKVLRLIGEKRNLTIPMGMECLSNLEELTIHCVLSDESFQNLFSMSTISSLCINEESGLVITSEKMTKFHSLKNLTNLSLRGCIITEEASEILCNIQTLVSLNLFSLNNRIHARKEKNRQIINSISTMQNLTSLSLVDCFIVECESIGTMNNLTRLDLSRNTVDQSVVYLSDLRNLKTLALGVIPLNTGLDWLIRMEWIQELTIPRRSIDRNALKKLACVLKYV